MLSIRPPYDIHAVVNRGKWNFCSAGETYFSFSLSDNDDVLHVADMCNIMGKFWHMRFRCCLTSVKHPIADVCFVIATQIPRGFGIFYGGLRIELNRVS